MRIQRVQNNNYNKPSFRALILDDSLKRVLNELSFNDLQEIKKVRDRLKDTKYYDLLVSRKAFIGIEPTFVPKDKDGILLLGRANCWETMTREDKEFRKSKLKWLESNNGYNIRHIATFDFASSDDAIKAKNIADKADIRVESDNYYGKFTHAVKAWGDVCLEVLEKSMAFMASGKPKVLTESEKLIKIYCQHKKMELVKKQ